MIAVMADCAPLPGDRRRLFTDTPFRRQRRAEERMKALGAWLDFVKPEEVMLFLLRAVRARRQVVIANHNSHSLYLMRRERWLREFYDSADLVQVDSQPLILWSKLRGRAAQRFHRSTYLDWRETFWAMAAAEGLKVYFVGGEPGVADRATEALKSRWPGAEIGCHHGYFDCGDGAAANEEVLNKIAAFAPDVLLVGMGMPRQELWIHRNLDRLPHCAILPVGAAFDYEAGHQTAAPRWMGRLGVEWAYRLFADPRRMFSRYCIEPWFLLGAVLNDTVRPLDRAKSDLTEQQLLEAAGRRGEWAPRGYDRRQNARAPLAG